MTGPFAKLGQLAALYGVADLLARMGAAIDFTPEGLTVTGGSAITATNSARWR